MSRSNGQRDPVQHYRQVRAVRSSQNQDDTLEEQKAWDSDSIDPALCQDTSLHLLQSLHDTIFQEHLLFQQNLKADLQKSKLNLTLVHQNLISKLPKKILNMKTSDFLRNCEQDQSFKENFNLKIEIPNTFLFNSFKQCENLMEHVKNDYQQSIQEHNNTPELVDQEQQYSEQQPPSIDVNNEDIEMNIEVEKQVSFGVKPQEELKSQESGEFGASKVKNQGRKVKKQELSKQENMSDSDEDYDEKEDEKEKIEEKENRQTNQNKKNKRTVGKKGKKGTKGKSQQKGNQKKQQTKERSESEKGRGTRKNQKSKKEVSVLSRDEGESDSENESSEYEQDQTRGRQMTKKSQAKQTNNKQKGNPKQSQSVAAKTKMNQRKYSPQTKRNENAKTDNEEEDEEEEEDEMDVKSIAKQKRAKTQQKSQANKKKGKKGAKKGAKSRSRKR